jgi:metal-responsive CopG/Arc/MetJ family transcriptional regulator
MATAVMKRVTASIPDRLYERLQKLAEREGRSMSNLVSYLLERGVDTKDNSND